MYPETTFKVFMSKRTTEKGVYPETTFKVFMSTVKETIKKVENLTGRKPTPAQRDEVVAKYHVQCIIDNRFPHPTEGVVERDR